MVERAAPSFLGQVSVLRRKFDKSFEVDEKSRLQIAKKFEALIIDRSANDRVAHLFKHKAGASTVSSNSSFATTMVKVKSFKECWGRTTFKVGNKLEDVAALYWNFVTMFQLQYQNNKKYNSWGRIDDALHRN